MSKARDLAGIFNLNPTSGTTAQRPATAEVGEIYYNGTTGKTQIYTPTGWQDMASGIPYGNTAGRPAAVTGQPYFNGETARLEMYTATGWQNIVQEVPGVASITGTYSEQTNSGTITIQGTNFVSGAIASAIGSNGVEVLASSTTYNSLVQVVATFTNLSNAQEPYDIKVTNPSNLFGLIPDALYVSASPVWQTASGSLGTFNEQVSVNLSATATDSDSTITYALANGSSLPTGVTLNSTTGAITGSLPDITTDTTYTFTVNASDGLNVIPRAFSITSSALLIEYLLVGGGGSGGHDVGGGGGAGGLLTGTYGLSNTKSFAISVGAGAPAISSNAQRNNGENTTGFGLIAYGGGGGGNWQGTDNGSRNGANGGSGGGGGGWSQVGYGGTGTSGQGFAGGNNLTASNSSGGGGGGAGGPGQVSVQVTGNDSGQAAGGIGVSSSITGTSITYATGGKGGGDTTPDSNTSNGTDGLGNGGDGQGISAYRRGGNGTLIIAYRNTYPALTIPGTLTYDQPTRSGYRVYRFTAGSGTVTF